MGTPHIPSRLPSGDRGRQVDCGLPRPSRTACAPGDSGSPASLSSYLSGGAPRSGRRPACLPPAPQKAAPVSGCPGIPPPAPPRRAQVIPGGPPLPLGPGPGGCPGRQARALAGRRFPAVSSASSGPGPSWGLQSAHPSPSVHQGHFRPGAEKKELYKYARLARCELQGVC